MRAQEFVNEKINPRTLRTGFQRRKEILDGRFYILAYGKDGKYSGKLEVKVYTNEDQPKEVAFAIFGLKERIEDKEPYLRVAMINVSTNYRRLGIAKEIYQFVNDLGNDIMPSENQTDDGQAMWKYLQGKVRQPTPVASTRPVKKPGYLQRILGLARF